MASEWNGPIIDEFTFDDPTIFGSPTITGPIIPVEPEEPATLEGVMDNDHGEWFGLDFWNGGGQPRQLRELTKGDWRPTRMRFEGLWTEEELPSIWYETRYKSLFRQTRKFVLEYFGYGDLPATLAAGEGVPGLVWLEGGSSKHFRCFVKKVAKQDNNAGGWDALLVNRRKREWLLTGVIGKALETCVFEDLLFGADEGQKKMLEAQDECTLEFEGYRRTTLRSQSVRGILADNNLTPDFWPCVDERALQLTALLLPMIRMMDKYFDATKSLRDVYQDLHNIVAEAGCLSIGMRWSGTIFHFSSPFLGEMWNLSQEQVDDTIYNASVEANKTADAIAEAKRTAEQSRKRQEEEAQSNYSTLRNRGTAIITSALDRVKAVRRCLTGEMVNPWAVLPAGDRLGKVQMVVWPALQRFATAGGFNPETGDADGESVTTILRSQVLYCYGRDNEWGVGSDYWPSLAEWVHQTKRKRMWDFLLSLRWVTYAVGSLLLLSCATQYRLVTDNILQVVRHGLVKGARHAVRETVLFMLDVAITTAAMAIGAVKAMLFLVSFVRDSVPRLLMFGLVL